MKLTIKVFLFIYIYIFISDPISQLEEKQQLISHQRAEQAEIENEIDSENTSELVQLRGEIKLKIKEELGQQKLVIVDRLKQNGQFYVCNKCSHLTSVISKYN